VLKSGILNPAINSLLSRVRHTNYLVIADRGFPYWPEIETVDISLTDDIPRVTDVLRAVLGQFHAGRAYMAEEFTRENDARAVQAFETFLAGVPILREPHIEFKRRVPGAIGLIRTADTTQYANVILESA
jgi:D-ribose pyranase